MYVCMNICTSRFAYFQIIKVSSHAEIRHVVLMKSPNLMVNEADQLVKYSILTSEFERRSCDDADIHELTQRESIKVCTLIDHCFDDEFSKC
jgi:hypothetical protein